MKNYNNNPENAQSAINNVQAGNDINVNGVVQNYQTFKNSSASYNHIITIIDRYKQRKASITQFYKTEKQQNREYLCGQLRSYCEEIAREINDIQARKEKEDQEYLRDLNKEFSIVKAAIKRLEQLIKQDIDEIKIIYVLEHELLQNLCGDTEERVQAIKEDYESKQEKSEEDFEQQVKNCEQERDIAIYKHELVQKLLEDRYPLSRESKIYLERISSDLNLDESIIEESEKEIIEPFYEENFQKYEQAYEKKLEDEGFPLSYDTVAELDELEESLGLQEYSFKHLNIRDAEEQLVKPHYNYNFKKFIQTYKDKLEEEKFPLSRGTIDELKNLQVSLGLSRFSFKDLDVKATKVELIELPYQGNLQKYRQTYSKTLEEEGFPLSSNSVEKLENLKNSLGLNNSYFELLGLEGSFSPEIDSENIEKEVTRPFYHENIKKYEQAYQDKIKEGKITLRTDIYNDLESLRQALSIRYEDSKIVESLIYRTFKTEHFVNNYHELRELLVDAKWQEADVKTREVILKLAGQEKAGKLDDKSVQNFPSSDIYIIDRLWVEYSKGRFGFSVQKRIFNEVKQERQKFAEKVGWSDKAGLLRGMFAWKPYSKLDFTLNAPEGHMPIWGAKDQKIFADNFLHLKVWNFEEGNLRSELSTVLVSHQEYYSEEAFWQKVKKFARKAGEGTIEKVLLLFYAAKQPNIPLGVKLTIITALGYFILPLDFISDFIPIAGWTDDLGALGAALTSAIPYITPEVKEQVKKKMREIFGK